MSDSPSVSRAAMMIGVEPTGMCRVTSRQRSGVVEVKRVDGLVAGMLRQSESAVLHPPLTVTLHTAEGACATVVVTSTATTGPSSGTTPRQPDPFTTRAGWGTDLITDPPPGLDWFVAAGMAAMLLHRGRQSDPNYVVPRGVLLRACGRWLGTAKSEGWLANKFRHASDNLGVPFEANPAQQLAEYVVQNQLLSPAALTVLAAEYDRRSTG
ncbi:hypothetical protein ACMYYO_10375 [Dermacoccaceae bacterium W4C1]